MLPGPTSPKKLQLCKSKSTEVKGAQWEKVIKSTHSQGKSRSSKCTGKDAGCPAPLFRTSIYPWSCHLSLVRAREIQIQSHFHWLSRALPHVLGCYENSQTEKHECPGHKRNIFIFFCFIYQDASACASHENQFGSHNNSTKKQRLTAKRKLPLTCIV